jgi:hypothetical protein
MWVWIAIGLGCFFAVSLAVALVVARMLGAIAGEMSALYESAEWAVLPPSRAHAQEAVVAQDEPVAPVAVAGR